ncbi:uncharacterized protein LOC136032296 isoform X1 [Artemia franciscana]|uniref:uncharacterized protein LOC136032296 isoform X1 n=1 Tax=Artemia franciscana TaxID=6661 RepID=UPI0032DBA725
MEVVKPVDHSGIQTPDRLFEGVHLHNITRYSSQDHRISEKLSLTSMNGNDRLMDKDGKPEEIDTLPYTAGVLSIFIALFFLFGLIGAAIKEARDRKRDERKGMVAPLLVRSLQTFVRPAGFDVDKLGRNMFDGTFCEMGRIPPSVSVLSQTQNSDPTLMLPGLSSKSSNFDIHSLRKLRPHLEPDIFVSIISQEITVQPKGKSEPKKKKGYNNPSFELENIGQASSSKAATRF